MEQFGCSSMKDNVNVVCSTAKCDQILAKGANSAILFQAKSGSSTLDSMRMFAAGGCAGAIARTCTAPLDRMKLLFQVQAVNTFSPGQEKAYQNIGQAFFKIMKEEGFLSFWKGNGTNIIRIFPYSAAQLMANDQYKRLLADDNACIAYIQLNLEKTLPQIISVINMVYGTVILPIGQLTIYTRLTAGAMAGMTATALTHPLDTVRLRLALPNHPYSGMTNAFLTMTRTEGIMSLYKGLAPTLVGIAPYAALNFASYDMLKAWYYGQAGGQQSFYSNFFLGATSGMFAATVCYPLDTIRRRMQMKGHTYKGQLDAFKQIYIKEGITGFFRGWGANSLKVVPQNSIRFVSYEIMKTLFGVQKKKTDT